jgi:hypothetical protein
MKPVPKIIGDAKVTLFTPIDSRHCPTGNCEQIVAGKLEGLAAGLAICRYEGESSYYLFGCDAEWNSVTDTWHPTLEDAKEQANSKRGSIKNVGSISPDI